MSVIDELIERLCPSGVEYANLGSLCEKTTNIKWKTVGSDEFSYIDLTSVDIRLRRITQTSTISTDNAPSRAQQIVKVDDVLFATTRPTQMRVCQVPDDYDGQICSTGFCVFRPSQRILSNYLLHVLGTADFCKYLEDNQTMGNYPAISNKLLFKYRIPVPPMEVQQEIVRVLDSFTKLEAELEAELEARNRQYAHYRDELLEPTKKRSVLWRSLSEIAAIYDGTHQTPKYVSEGVRFVSVENIGNPYGSDKFITQEAFDKYKVKPKRDDVLMTRIGTIGLCSVLDRDEELAYYVSLALIRPDTSQVLPRYLKYIIESSLGRRELRKRTLVNAVPIKVNLGDVGKIRIPVPSLEEQKQVVAILDKFDALVNDITQGIPAEIEARRKQYAYYRDKLLAFEERTA